MDNKVAYRGKVGMLFKRDFCAFYLEKFPILKWIDYWLLWQREFPNLNNLH